MFALHFSPLYLCILVLEVVVSHFVIFMRITSRTYRPHPKDGEGTVFTGVCVYVCPQEGGTPWFSTYLNTRVPVRDE